jgi:hypothetical protein
MAGLALLSLLVSSSAPIWRPSVARPLAEFDQMHHLARFNLRIARTFRLAEWQAATRAPAPGTTSHVN